MRILVTLMLALFLIAPGATADDEALTVMHEGCPDDSPEEHDECHEEQDAPAIGPVAALGALGALAFLARRRL